MKPLLKRSLQALAAAHGVGDPLPDVSSADRASIVRMAANRPPTAAADPDTRLQKRLAYVLTHQGPFSRQILRRPLRSYQLEPANAIVKSVLQNQGLTFAITMSRQAGKNETAGHIEALLLNLFRRRGGYMVKASPTFKPQTQNSIQRLQSLLNASLLGGGNLESGYIIRLDRARAAFFSAGPAASVVGATANILLQADEAQDIDEAKWNKDFRPMGASTNVTTALWGTAWTSYTLLARTKAALRWLEAKDGIKRVFEVDWKRVAKEVPAYGEYVKGEIARLGILHPLIQSQYLLKEIDAEGGMFSLSTQSLMKGTHPRQRSPSMNREYAILVDVAGASEDRKAGALLRQQEPRKDSTALTIVEITRLPMGMPRFLVIDRYWWTGTPHPQIYGAILRLVDLWGPTRIVVDATGVGAGLASFLSRPLGARLQPFIFTTTSKSDLGWRFLGICNSGRFLDYADDGSPERTQFWREVAAADYEIVDGPNKRMRWGVADPKVHDDLLMSAALVATMDQDQLGPHVPSQVVQAPDVLAS